MSQAAGLTSLDFSFFIQFLHKKIQGKLLNVSIDDKIGRITDAY